MGRIKACGSDVIDENVVKRYVSNIDKTKPSGLSNLNNRLLCDAFKVLTFELTTLFNDSITQEVFPREWKHGTITAIPKPGNAMLKTNWRPFTSLCTPGKLLEKIAHFQTSTYCDKSELSIIGWDDGTRDDRTRDEGTTGRKNL